VHLTIPVVTHLGIVQRALLELMFGLLLHSSGIDRHDVVARVQRTTRSVVVREEEERVTRNREHTDGYTNKNPSTNSNRVQELRGERRCSNQQ
jgi:hypothetical protein